MPGQVPEQVKSQRVKKLEELCARLHAAFVEANRGIREEVLWESREKDGSIGGYTGNYIRLSRPFDASLVNSIQGIII